ncbi:MAG: hypothetical protein A2X86_08430 [Bdellovibrionales bacterium GWA2_49_15]|nr:MAG: hypothetical protein A2X86_08430 [Bdellovibrionales bacterium GWA2_49_15]
MQVVNLIDRNSRPRTKWSYKLAQIYRAKVLEQVWSKDEILEAYFNLVAFQGELQGLPAAAEGLFQKKLERLVLQERLWLWALIPAPNQSYSLIVQRACLYGKKLAVDFDCSVLKDFAPTYRARRPIQLATHFSYRFKKAGLIKTTLDKQLQHKAQAMLATQLEKLRDKNVRDGAILVIDRYSGEELIYVGSSGNFSKSAMVDHVTSPRQTGSTLKPFLYAQAIQLRYLTMSSLLRDERFAITIDGLTYQPENYNNSFLNKSVPLKEALGSSLNIPAIKVIDLVGVENFYFWLGELGIKLPGDEKFYGHSLALGSADVTLHDLVYAYKRLANGESPVSKEVSFIIAEILSDKQNRIHTFGLNSTLNTTSWSAVKTGTSKDMRDNWCLGWTDKVIIGVWIGNSSGDPMWNVTGISGAAPIFNELVTLIHEGKGSLAPKLPEGIVQKNQQYYLKGTEPLNLENKINVHTSIAKITSPTHLAQYAYDPDIPAKAQQLPLKASGVRYPRWIVNGKTFHAKNFSIAKKGKYRLELWEQAGSKLVKKDELIFYVRAGKMPYGRPRL